MGYDAIKSFPLSEIDFSRLILIKEAIYEVAYPDQTRWVFRTTPGMKINGEEDLYLKIWNPSYFRRDNILSGIQAGFYDTSTTPALIGLITHREICRGYIMRRCTYHHQINFEFHSLIHNRTQQTGLFFLQYSRYHIMRMKKAYSLIDLEAIYPLHDLPRILDYRKSFEDEDYARFVYRLYTEKYPFQGLRITDLLLPSARQAVEKQSFIRHMPQPQRKIKAAGKHIKDWIVAHQGLPKKHLGLIEL